MSKGITPYIPQQTNSIAEAEQVLTSLLKYGRKTSAFFGYFHTIFENQSRCYTLAQRSNRRYDFNDNVWAMDSGQPLAPKAKVLNHIFKRVVGQTVTEQFQHLSANDRTKISDALTFLFAETLAATEQAGKACDEKPLLDLLKNASWGRFNKPALAATATVSVVATNLNTTPAVNPPNQASIVAVPNPITPPFYIPQKTDSIAEGEAVLSSLVHGVKSEVIRKLLGILHKNSASYFATIAGSYMMAQHTNGSYDFATDSFVYSPKEGLVLAPITEVLNHVARKHIPKSVTQLFDDFSGSPRADIKKAVEALSFLFLETLAAGEREAKEFNAKPLLKLLDDASKGTFKQNNQPAIQPIPVVIPTPNPIPVDSVQVPIQPPIPVIPPSPTVPTPPPVVAVQPIQPVVPPAPPAAIPTPTTRFAQLCAAIANFARSIFKRIAAILGC